VFIPILIAACTRALENTYGISSWVWVSGKLQLKSSKIAVIVLVPVVGENIDVMA
jgi:predicted Abi (CAAX) family protease